MDKYNENYSHRQSDFLSDESYVETSSDDLSIEGVRSHKQQIRRSIENRLESRRLRRYYCDLLKAPWD